MRTYLVTGGAGFIGSNFIRYILSNEPEIQIINLDALTYSGNIDNLKDLSKKSQYIFIQGNICDRDLLTNIFSKYGINKIIHFAAESHVDRSITNPSEFIQSNILGTFNLIEISKNYWIDKLNKSNTFRFHHISTDEVYGSLNPDFPAWTEDTPYDPKSPYSASKAASDHLVRSFGHTYGFPFSITNCSNNYGPFQFPEKLIPLTIINAIHEKPIPIYGDGKQIRDWVHVEDHCHAINLVINKAPIGSTYNIGGNNQTANIDLVNLICKLLDELLPRKNGDSYNKLIEFVADRPGHDTRYAMNISKISKDLGWMPRYNLEDGLRKTIIWYLSNMDWIDSIKKQKKFISWIDQNYSKRGFITK